MKRMFCMICLCLSVQSLVHGQPGTIGYHPVRLDETGRLLSWYDTDAGKSYDFVVRQVWNFWSNMRRDPNGLPYFMSHQIWTRDRDEQRGIGGDQLQMALSAWRLLYAYLGDEKILDNMRFMADYYLTHSLSPEGCKWPGIPYPYNTLTYSGVYDGDMICGKNHTQPDKAGSLGIELVNLYKMTKKEGYLSAAVQIANTLAANTVQGDLDHSPLPFRVNALTGAVGVIRPGTKDELKYGYTTNWSGTLRLFDALDQLQAGRPVAYRKAAGTILGWMKRYPMRNNKWGPFFEDVGEWSDTQINAVTFATYILEHPGQFPAGKREARAILDWGYKELGNDGWLKYGVQVVNEQTSYRVPGNSHTARQGAAEMLYGLLSGDSTARERGLRQLNWSTYWVNSDGESTYPNHETWLTDGYGDFARHYLRLFSYEPALSPDDQNHLVRSSSVVRKIAYNLSEISYQTFDDRAIEVLKLRNKPIRVVAGDRTLSETTGHEPQDGWTWDPCRGGGLLTIDHRLSGKVVLVLP
ncbi:MAG: hypothetical protein LWW85_01760 [Marinilabiliales bacterium]|nr:hypothetical protein [Marinilabiliales bacterium]